MSLRDRIILRIIVDMQRDLIQKAVQKKTHMDNIAADNNIKRINVANYQKLVGIRNIIPMETLTTKQRQEEGKII